MEAPLQSWSFRLLVRLFKGEGYGRELDEHELRDIGLERWEEEIDFLPKDN